MTRIHTTVFYDGGCPVCLRGVRHYRRLDWAGRLRWVDLMEEPEALAARGVGFAEAMEHIHVVDRAGALRVGMHGFTALWSELPGYRHLAALLTGAGLVPALDRLYRRATSGRFARRCAGGACTVSGPGRETPLAGGSTAPLHGSEQRGPRIRAMFDRIAARYDLMNDLMSLGIHRLWKRRLAWALDARPGDVVLDLAGGTGDVARLVAASGARVIVCDPALGMMRTGRTRTRTAGWIAGVGERLPIADDSLDGLTVAFGVRNMTSMREAFAEARRVLRPGGRLACLEFSHPHPVVRPFYALFSRTVIPLLGAAVAGDRGAYRYLVESIERFPDQEALAAMLREAGLESVRYRNVSFGIGCIHLAEAPVEAPGLERLSDQRSANCGSSPGAGV